MGGCIVCGGSVATPARGRRPKFCSGRCRVKAHRDQKRVVDGVPAELRERARWIRHQAKRPMAVGGWWCSVTNPSHWSTYEDAADSSHGDGLGFVLNGDGIVCIDLDDCVTDGVPNVEARALIKSLPKTYVEFSPSGRGLHVWGFASLVAGRRFERDGLKVEVYPDGRYLTVTGRAYRSAPFASLRLSELLT
jgi:primase-polymerase (primpol)-like protein